MPRKGPAAKRPVEVDPVYGSQLVTQLVNKVLVDGKKQVAERIVHTALEGCRTKTDTDPVVTLKRALDNVKPLDRGQEPPRGWRDVPGADRGPRRAARPRSHCAGSSSTRSSAARRPCPSA